MAIGNPENSPSAQGLLPKTISPCTLGGYAKRAKRCPAAAHRQPKDVAADGRARTTPPRRGAALDTFRPLDREQELSRGRPKRVDCRGSRCGVELPKDVFNPIWLNVRLVQGVASYLTSYQQIVCLRRHPIDLKKRNATPLRSGWWLRVTYCYVA
jgi:hypothetical protein